MKKLRGSIRLGTLSQELTLLLQDKIQVRCDLPISESGSSGKTSLSNMIENIFEIQIRRSSLARFEAHRVKWRPSRHDLEPVEAAGNRKR